MSNARCCMSARQACLSVACSLRKYEKFRRSAGLNVDFQKRKTSSGSIGRFTDNG